MAVVVPCETTAMHNGGWVAAKGGMVKEVTVVALAVLIDGTVQAGAGR